jgi:hypothetical protein
MLVRSPPPAEVAAVLGPRERLIWCDRPPQGIRFHWFDIYLVPFSLLWGGAALTAEGLAIYSNDPLLALVCLPFALFALFLTFGRFFVDSALRRKMFYALTSERVLIISELWGRQTMSIDLRKLGEVHLSLRASGVGTITLGHGVMFFRFFRVFSWPISSRYQPPVFDTISDAATVEALIRQAQRAVD